MAEDTPPPEDQDDAPKRRGRARERQQRRQERQQRTTSRPRDVGHLGAAGPHFSLPTFDIRRLRLGIALGFGVLVVVAVILFLRGLKPAAPEVLPNSLWIGTEWTYERHTDDEINTLVQQLHDNQIGTIYAWVSWLQEDGTWRGAENFVAVKDFAKQIEAADPDLNVYGWIGFPVEVGGEDYRLDDEEITE